MVLMKSTASYEQGVTQGSSSVALANACMALSTATNTETAPEGRTKSAAHRQPLWMTALRTTFAAVVASALLGSSYAMAGGIAQTALMRGTAHADRGSLGAAMAFASRWSGAAMATMTARIGAMSLIVLVSVDLKSSGVTTVPVFPNGPAAMVAGTVPTDRTKTSVPPVAGRIKFDALVEAA